MPNFHVMEVSNVLEKWAHKLVNDKNNSVVFIMAPESFQFGNTPIFYSFPAMYKDIPQLIEIISEFDVTANE